MFSFSLPELGVILVLVLIIFGPGKLPDFCKALGRGIQELRRATVTNSSEIVRKDHAVIAAKAEEIKN